MSSEHGQADRTRWVNCLRAEVMQVGKRTPEVARVAQVGVWLATFADADGTNAFPGREVLAVLAGCSKETVTRAVKVMVGVGILERRRRPNTSSMYYLRPFQPGALRWEEHLHHYTDTAQRRAHQRKREEDAAERARKASMDTVRDGEAAAPEDVHGHGPEDVHGGSSGPAAEGPEDVHGHPRKASMDTVRKASTEGPYKGPPTSGRDPLPDTDTAAVVPQPQDAGAGAGACAVKDAGSGEAGAGPGPSAGFRPPRGCQRSGCEARLIRGGTLCSVHRDEAAGSPPRPQKPVQAVILTSVPSGAGEAAGGGRAAVPGPREDPSAPARTCGCGRTYRAQEPGPCPDCVMARRLEQAGTG